MELLLCILSAALNMIPMRQKHPIDPLIEAKRTALAKAERNIDKLKIEIATLEKARDATPVDKSTARSRRVPRSSATVNGASAEKRRGRSLSEAWKGVLFAIASKHSTGASLDEIARFCEVAGISLKRPTLRAQLSNYAKRGYVERARDGVFAITLEGMKLAGSAEGNKQISGEGQKEAEAPR